MNRHIRPLLVIALAACVGQAVAQFDPLNAQWGKQDPNHIRIISWNVEDGICSLNTKEDIVNDWNALVRVVAALQPDILCLQEAGDNSGNGHAGGLDSVASLETVIDLFFRGGTDPFLGGPVTSYVQKYSSDPNYNLPYIFVSELSDFGFNSGFNRNVIISRWPFVDLNGDNRSRYNDIYFVNAGWTSGNGDLRGYQMAEIDLPNDKYAGDLVVGNGHFKSGGGTGNENRRVRSGKNVGFFIEHFYNGAGTGTVDPTNAISDNPPATMVLDDYTPFIACGDWNNDPDAPLLNPGNLKQGARWLVEQQHVEGDPGTPDGPDRDGSDMSFDDARRLIITFNNQIFEGSAPTNSAGKIDFVSYQDSIVTKANSFVYDPFEHNGIYPPPVASYPGSPFNIVKDATDHWPVTVDFIFPRAMPGVLCGDMNCDNQIDASDISPFVVALLNPDRYASKYPDCDAAAGDIDQSGELDASDISPFVRTILSGSCP